MVLRLLEALSDHRLLIRGGVDRSVLSVNWSTTSQLSPARVPIVLKRAYHWIAIVFFRLLIEYFTVKIGSALAVRVELDTTCMHLPLERDIGSVQVEL